MVEETREVCSALEAINTITGLSVYRTDWYAEKANAAPPFFIINYANPEDKFLLENSRGLRDGNFFRYEASVPLVFETDPLEALEALEALHEAGRAAIEAAFPNQVIDFIAPEVAEIPGGKQIVLSFLATLYIG